MAKKNNKPKKNAVNKAKARSARSASVQSTVSYTSRESSTTMTRVVRFRVSEADQSIIQNAAIITGLEVSEFLRQAALEKAASGEPVDQLEKNDGEWFYKGRKLKVFENYYYLTQTGDSEKEWADLYGIPLAAVKQAKRLCQKIANKEYENWVEYWENEERRDNESGVRLL